MGRIAQDNQHSRRYPRLYRGAWRFLARVGQPDAQHCYCGTRSCSANCARKVEIGDDEIDAVIDRIRANAGKEEYLVSEIYLAVDNPKDEDQVRQLARESGRAD
jgi:peptidyl-prolyl cis-trans isomerase SurA